MNPAAHGQLKIGASRRPFGLPVALPGQNYVLLEQDPGLPSFFEQLKGFLKNAT
jgi:hypothetical protein